MPNRLAKETSPYLRQHAEIAVDWYPWGEEAFRRARDEDKPIQLSVGYAACHWCHVMAHESFEKPDVARLMNERFVNIKVDRQERPDVDDIYQKVVQMMRQGGGWPLTVFMTPAGEPFFGGTYFPREDRYGRPGFVGLLLGLSEAWKTKRDELRGNIDQFLKGYQVLDERFLDGELPAGEDVLAEAARFFAENTDPRHGYRAVELDPLEEACLLGLRDKLFAAREKRVRPSRDDNVLASWNALMIQGLCAAYQATGTASHLSAAQRAADFLTERMTMPHGGVYRAWREGEAKVPGFLDDYAFLANALLDLYELCFEKRDLDRAAQLVELILEKFWDDGLYFTPSDSERLVHRPRAPHDNAWPSGISTSVFTLLRLYELTGKDHYRDRAEHVFRTYGGAAAKNPFGFAHLLAALDFMQRGPLEIVFAGDRAQPALLPLVETVHRTYQPSRVLAFADDVPVGQGRVPIDGKPAAYVGRNRTCDAPVTTAEALRERCST